MKKKLFGATAATLAIAGALALVGCGGSQDPAAGSAAGKAGDDAAYTLVEDGTFTIGTSAEYEPFEYGGRRVQGLRPRARRAHRR